MLSPRRRNEDGMVAFNLVATLAFALFAVIQLSRTTIAAQQIDDRVDIIVGEVGTIDEDLGSVAKLDQTDEIAKEILAAATPLSGQADEIIAAAKSIDSKVDDINDNAASINGTVKGIRGNFTNLQPVVRSINDGVAGINGRVDKVIATVAGIKSDLGNVLAQVGTTGPSGHGPPNNRNIHGHANNIDCSTAVNGASCER